MTCLCGRCRGMTLMSRSLFRRGRSNGCSAGSAVVADVASGPAVAYGLLISVMEVPNIYVIHGSVVAELVVIPISALVADTTIAISVVNAAVESDGRAPVAFVPKVCVVTPTPVTWSPEQANAGRLDPCAGHPKIAIRTVSPVTGSPQIAFLRTKWLRVRNQLWRSNRDRDTELREQSGRNGQH